MAPNPAGTTSPEGTAPPESTTTIQPARSSTRRAGRDRREHNAIEERISELAAEQHGLLTRTQLSAAGLGLDAVKYRLMARRLRPVQRGVPVGPAGLAQERRWPRCWRAARARW
jgi:hypothetical protein